MALPNSGYIQLGTDAGTGRSINTEYGYGNDMASYLGVYYGKGGQEFRFPVPGNSLDVQGFYGTSKISGGATYVGTGYYTIPVYNTINITVKGGDGGQAGEYGYNSCNGQPSTVNWNAGGGGNTSSFGGYVAAGGGSGGGGNHTGGNSGATSNSGTLTNPVQGGNGPPSGSQIYVTVGNGGNGGGGGANFGGWYCGPTGNAANGSGGAAGYVYVSWS